VADTVAVSTDEITFVDLLDEATEGGLLGFTDVEGFGASNVIEVHNFGRKVSMTIVARCALFVSANKVPVCTINVSLSLSLSCFVFWAAVLFHGLAGGAGFEPAVGRLTASCLATWLPSSIPARYCLAISGSPITNLSVFNR
jgi:hypothetical protein